MAKRPFIDTFRELEYGHLLDELTDAQNELIQAVQHTNKPGKITIELEYKPEGEGQLVIKSKMNKKLPQLPRGSSIFFVTPERNLTRLDPRQQQLELKQVGSDKPDLKEISNG